MVFKSEFFFQTQEQLLRLRPMIEELISEELESDKEEGFVIRGETLVDSKLEVKEEAEALSEYGR